MLNTTRGISFSAASAIVSCISAMPWPVEPVAARAPVAAAPSAMLTPSISVSAWISTPPMRGSRVRTFSSSPVNGDIGYPAKKRQPASMADSAIAS